MTQPAQPVITIAVADALTRIETKVDAIRTQLITKAETAAVHELETRVRVLETTQASQSAVGQALTRARGAMWAGIRVAVNEVARSSPPAECQLLGGTWNVWDGWRCG